MSPKIALTVDTHNTTRLGKRQRKKQKPIQKIRAKQNRNQPKKNICGFRGQHNWNPQHNCPAKTVKCNSCQKIGNFARLCRGKPNNNTRNINCLGDITSEEDNDESEPEEIRQIKQVNKITPDNNDHYGV